MMRLIVIGGRQVVVKSVDKGEERKGGRNGVVQSKRPSLPFCMRT